MLSGRRKKDYAADALAAQVIGGEFDAVGDTATPGSLDPGDPEADELEVAAVA